MIFDVFEFSFFKKCWRYYFVFYRIDIILFIVYMYFMLEIINIYYKKYFF